MNGAISDVDVDNGGGQAGRRRDTAAVAFAASSTLRSRSRRVGTPVFAVGDSKVGVVCLVLDSVDRFDGIRDVGKIDEGAVPNAGSLLVMVLRRRGDRLNVLFFEEIDQFNIPVFPKVALEPLLGEEFKVFDVADVNVTRSSGVNGECYSGGKRARVLSPSHFETTVVESQALECRHLIESERSGRIDKHYELGDVSQPSQAPEMHPSRWLTAICLSCMYRMLCNIPPLIELQRSSVVVSGWILPK
jgi:hypothetical protein